MRSHLWCSHTWKMISEIKQQRVFKNMSLSAQRTHLVLNNYQWNLFKQKKLLSKSLDRYVCNCPKKPASGVAIKRELFKASSAANSFLPFHTGNLKGMAKNVFPVYSNYPLKCWHVEIPPTETEIKTPCIFLQIFKGNQSTGVPYLRKSPKASFAENNRADFPPMHL